MEDIVDTESSLRPITTIGFNRNWQGAEFDFPKLYDVSETFPVMLFNPISSYTEDRNERFIERYKNIIPPN
jgi:hypothetical protein